jgi:amino acid transporter
VKNKVTLFPLIAAIYLMVSGGPFGLEDTVSQAGYAGAILILLITPLIWALPTALSGGGTGQRLPEEGGLRVGEGAMGPFWGFREAWLSLVGSIFDAASLHAVRQLYRTLQSRADGHGRGIWIGGADRGLRGGEPGGRKSVGASSFVFTAALLSPFAVLTVYGVLHPAPAAPSAGVHYDFLLGILVAMWNYMGWDNSSTIAGEVDRPQRTYPRAMVGAVSLVALTYVLPIAAVAVTDLSPGTWGTGGWADVARADGGRNGSGRIAIGITIGGMMGARRTECATLSLAVAGGWRKTAISQSVCSPPAQNRRAIRRDLRLCGSRRWR